MFFNRILRNLFGVVVLFVLAINIYHWTAQVEVYGNADGFTYFGFYKFNEYISTFPAFRYFTSSLQEVQLWISEISLTDVNIIIGVLTAGLSYLVQITYLLVQILVCLISDLFTILFWIIDLFTIVR